MLIEIPPEALLALGVLEFAILGGMLVWFVRRQWAAWRIRRRVNQRIEELRTA